jgi:uncharacterized repeat protein (TIGR01451 family)
MNRGMAAGLALALATNAVAGEVTLKNDSLTDFGNASIVWGFVAGEKAASWLTSPCTGNLVAVQIFWRSPSGVTPFVIADSIDIYRSGAFPQPGDLALEVIAPVLNDNALNEYRYLDENSTIPIVVPVLQDETVVVALTFGQAPLAGSDPSVVRDTDGLQANSNTIYADLGGGLFQWFPSSSLGLTGDWVIRAVVNCESVSISADVAVTMSADPAQYSAEGALSYTLTVANGGPAASPNTTIVDILPAALLDPEWTCTASGGATCTAGNSGNITDTANLPAGGQVVYTIAGTVAAGTTGDLTNSATAVVGAPASDPAGTNNTATLVLTEAVNDLLFADGFEAANASGIRLIPVPARARGGIPAAW